MQTPTGKREDARSLMIGPRFVSFLAVKHAVLYEKRDENSRYVLSAHIFFYETNRLGCGGARPEYGLNAGLF